ncbi:MAG TPA: DUF2235 domain-containing protein [Methylomirabilota bacterium]|nr:DUF2235 domain-containing protein [Methylomirabilota bacterium]
MSKTIIFCADGTWNGPGQDEEQEDQGGHPTNVFKVFLNLAGDLAVGTLRSADEQERSLSGADGRVTQIAKYLHGVGDSKNFLVRVLGGGGGAGLVTRIVRGYTFISRNFEPGDRIFIIGFSRGAYTARALAGLIAARGLLDPGRNDLATDRAQAYRLGAAEWFTYRREALKGKENLFHKLAEVAVDLPGFLQARATAPRIADVPIEAVVVWDTVGALGIPAYNLKTDTQLDAFQFADLVLSGKVRHGLHAVSVDEQRASFTPTLWEADERITQVLFPGAHADVGGGYPQNESGLSDCALQWVVDEMTKLGVAFAPTPAVPLKPDACGMAHAPWAQAPWNLLPRGQRGLPAGLAVHRSVPERLGGGDRLRAAGLALYEPESLAAAYLSGGQIKPGVRIIG